MGNRRTVRASFCSRQAWTIGKPIDVATWVSKIGLKVNPNTQLLEDAACLVFLENEIGSFATQHADYPREKFLEIIRKTWRKMSPSARHSAKGVSISPGITELVNEALQDLDA